MREGEGRVTPRPRRYGPLVWRPPPEGRPARLIPPPTRQAVYAETLDLLRDREREHREDMREMLGAIAVLVRADAEERSALEDGSRRIVDDVLASLDALDASSGAAEREAKEEARRAREALAKVMEAVVLCEARVKKGDAAGAARMLVRWLEKVRGT